MIGFLYVDGLPVCVGREKACLSDAISLFPVPDVATDSRSSAGSAVVTLWLSLLKRLVEDNEDYIASERRNWTAGSAH